MMLAQVIIDADIIRPFFYIIPALFIILPIIFHLIHEKSVEKGRGKATSWFIKPLKIKPFIQKRKADGKTQDESKPEKIPAKSKKLKHALTQLGLRFYIIMVFVFFIFVSLFLSFIFHECGHGIMCEIVGGSWIRIEIGLIYGLSYLSYPYTIVDGNIHYITSSWISLGGSLINGIVGVVFLLSVLIPRVRKSFFASLFNLSYGIASISAELQAWFSEAWQIEYGIPNFSSDTFRFLENLDFAGINVTTMHMLVGTTIGLACVQLLLIITFGKLWRQHYPKHRYSHVWFILLFEIAWWAVFFLWGAGFGLF